MMKRPDRRRVRCQSLAEATNGTKPLPLIRMESTPSRPRVGCEELLDLCVSGPPTIPPVRLAPAKPGGGESVCLLLLLGAQDGIERHERCLSGLHRLRHPRRHLFHAVEAFGRA
jgi:hypothetical protein